MKGGEDEASLSVIHTQLLTWWPCFPAGCPGGTTESVPNGTMQTVVLISIADYRSQLSTSYYFLADERLPVGHLCQDLFFFVLLMGFDHDSKRVLLCPIAIVVVVLRTI